MTIPHLAGYPSSLRDGGMRLWWRRGKDLRRREAEAEAEVARSHELQEQDQPVVSHNRQFETHNQFADIIWDAIAGPEHGRDK